MAHRIEVSSDLNDEGEAVRKRLMDDAGLEVGEVRIVDIYTIDGDLSRASLGKLGRELFSDPVVQRFSTDEHIEDRPVSAVEIGFRPGVLDTAGRTAEGAEKHVAGTSYTTFTSRRYVFSGRLSDEELEIAARYLSNALIHHREKTTVDQWKRVGGVYVPNVMLEGKPAVEIIDLSRMSNDELAELSSKRVLALDIGEMKALKRRHPRIRDGALETYAQTWSEHCCHKRFKGILHHEEYGRTNVIDSIFDTYIKGATKIILERSEKWEKRLISVFRDNAGIIDIGNGYCLAFKAETHNSPSLKDPEGGADTGTAVVRDITGAGRGFRPMFYTDVLCFADPCYKGEVPEGVFHPKRVTLGVHRGIKNGGNKKGIPVVNGTIRFDSYPFGSLVAEKVEGCPIQSYMGKPLVYCGAGGIAPVSVKGRPVHEKDVRPGCAIVMIGGRIGKDGIHGATFSSEASHKGSPATAVQLAHSITEKRNIDFMMAARDRDLFSYVTDNGAGGLACSVGETARISGGAELYLHQVPKKYSGMQPWEILLSESQEIMTLAVNPSKIRAFKELAKRYGVEASVIGKFTDSGRFFVQYGEMTVADMDMDFLHNGVPRKIMNSYWQEPDHEEPDFKQPDIGETLQRLLGRLNICSKEYFVRQFDHEVQGGTVVKPFTGVRNDGPSDAAIVWPVEFRRMKDFSGLGVSSGINANYGLIDPYWMAASNIDEAVRNAVVSGVDPAFIALLDNFCWSSSDDPFRMGQLVRAARGCYDFAVAYCSPFVSGKDSMFNDHRGRLAGKDAKVSVPPTLLISALGKIPDIRQAVTMDAKQRGSLLYLIGPTKKELGGSEYLAMLGSERGEAWVGKSVPRVDAAAAPASYRKLHKAIKRGLVYAAHDCSEGGLLVSLAESMFAGGIGAEIYLDNVPVAGVDRDDYVAFSESQSRIIAEVPENYAARFERIMNGSTYAAIGRTTVDERLRVYGLNGKVAANASLHDLKDAWQRTLKW